MSDDGPLEPAIEVTLDLPSVEYHKSVARMSIDALCSYVPASIIRFLSDHASGGSPAMTPPWRHSYETVVLFADVSGFTDLSERLAMKGREGSEQLAKHLNSYFEQLVRVIASQGGDVFKFAGDALLVLWPPSEDDVCTVARRAVQSALEIQRKMHNAKLQEDVVLSVKLGIGVGECSIVHVGGVLSRMEYLATGSPLIQAFASEHKAVAGQVVCSPEAWAVIQDHFVAQIISSGHAFVHRCTDRLRKVGIVKTANLDVVNDVRLIESISNYVPGAVLPFLNATEERWASELRHVAVIFANLGFTEEQLAKIASDDLSTELDRVQQVIFSVQTAIYQYEGSVNKFLLDDKGSTLVAVFGLPPVAHEDDSNRAILASLVMSKQLTRLGFMPAIGITTGTAFCGVVGSRSRREYSVLGDVVNLSARLMQHAKARGGGVLCDQTTQYSSRQGMAFEELPAINVKGKRDLVKVFKPIVSSVAPHGIWNQHKITTNGAVSPSAFQFVHSMHNPHAELSRSLKMTSTEASMTPAQVPTLSSLWGSYMPRTCKIEVIGDNAPVATIDDLAWAEHARNWLADEDDLLPLDALSITSPSLGNAETWARKLDRTVPGIVLPSRQSNGSRTLSGIEAPSVEQTPRNDAVEFRLRHSDLGEHPYKTAKFLIQNRGYVSIDCAKLQTVPQLKERLIDNLKKKMMVSQAATVDQFLVLLDNNVQLQNENVALVALTRTGTPGPVLELILHRKPEDRTETGLSAAEIIKIITQSISAWNRSTFVIEGEAGYGKSHLLAQVVREAAAFVLFRAANPLESKTPLGIWRELFMRLIDTEVTNRGLGEPAQMRKSFVSQFLSNTSIAGVLNEVLPLELDETDETLSMSPMERLSNCTAIMLALLGMFARQIGRIIIVIDDALLMDKLSWGFALRTSIDFTNIILILGTRPVNKSNLGAFDLEVPVDYTELLNQDITHRLLLRALGNDEIHQIALETLGVPKIPNTLGLILIQRSHGNPLVCKEILYALRKAQLIDVRSDKSGKLCILSDKFADLSAVPVPICLQNILGCRIDRLGHIHEIALKVASVIGNEIQIDLLTKSFPILEHVAQIPDIVNDLVNLNVFSIAHASVDITNGAGNIYQFVDGFMRDVALSRLLLSQKQLLLTRLNEVKTRNNYFADLQIKGGVQQSGFLTIRKAEASGSSMRIRVSTSKWKKRWVTLHENALALYYHPTHNRVLGIIFLDGASVSMAPPNVGKDFTIQVQAQYWTKKGVSSDTSRLFFVSAASMDDARHWLLKITNAIEKQFSIRERHEAEAAMFTEPNSHRNSEDASQSSDKFSAMLPRQTLRSSFTNSVQLLRRLKSSASIGGSAGGSSIRRSLLSLKINGRGQSLDLDPSQSVNSSISEIAAQRIKWHPVLQIDTLSTSPEMRRYIQQWLIEGNSFQTTEDSVADDNVLRPIAPDTGLVKCGFAQVVDAADNKWQRRWVVITADALIITVSQYEDDIMQAVHLPSTNISANRAELTITLQAVLSLQGANVVYDHPATVTLRLDDDGTFRDWTEHLCKSPSQVEGPQTSLQNVIDVVRGLADDVNGGRVAYESVSAQLSTLRALVSSLLPQTSEAEMSDTPLTAASLNSSPLNNVMRHSDWIVKVMDECDIDESTKVWLSRCYTTLGGQDLHDLRHRGSDQIMDPHCLERDVRAMSDVSSLQTEFELRSLDEDNTSCEFEDQRPSLVTFATPVESPPTIFTWDFEIFACEKPGLISVLVSAFDCLDLMTQFRMDRNVLNAFLQQVATSYLDNAYHNLFHAVDTTQTAACLLRTYGALSLITPLESLALIIAAICHDIGHPGLGNTYQINAGTQLALLYNDQAVLEQHHCAMTFRILKKAETNILAGLTPMEYRSVRKTIISSILATDMNCHFALSEKFSNLLARAGQSPNSSSSPRSSTTAQATFSQPDREIIVNMLLHAADISNQCKPWPIAKRWSDCILLEFYHQGDIERDAGLPISPNCDRNTTDRLQLALNFLDFVVAPLFVSLTQLLPQCIVACQSLRLNRQHWDALLIQSISNSNLPPDKNREEEYRWRRRLQSFDEMMLEAESDDVPIKNRKNSIQLFESFVRANFSSIQRNNSHSRQMEPITEHSRLPAFNVSDAATSPRVVFDSGQAEASFGDAIAEEEADQESDVTQTVTAVVTTIPAMQSTSALDQIPPVPKRGSILSRFWGSASKTPKL